MLASLALVSLLQPAAFGADGLAIANPHLTLGALGPTRAAGDVHPGDSLFLSFTINGIGVDEAGKASYSTAVEVSDAAGKSLIKLPAKKYQEFLPLGGSTLPAVAEIDLGVDSPAGKYTMVVTVTDNTTQKTASAKHDFTVAGKGFALVRLSASGDGDGLVPIGALSVGQTFFLHAAAVGFGVDGGKQPKVSVMLQVLDENNKPILSKPFSGAIDKNVPADASSLPIRFYVPLNRPGTYTLELSATDSVKNGTSKLTYPITVQAHK